MPSPAARRINKRQRKPLKDAFDAHWALVQALGGPTSVSNIIEARCGVKITPQAVSMMRKRGVAKGYRYLLAEEARVRGQADKVPANFVLGAQ